MKQNDQRPIASENEALSLPDNSTGMEVGSSAPFELHGHSEGEDELDEDEADMIFQVEKLVIERDDETDDEADLSEDSEVDTESDQESVDYGSDYAPRKIRGLEGRAGVSCAGAGVSNSTKTFTRKKGTKGNSKGGKQKKSNLAYEFCPLPHRPSILRLLMKHFCQHPLLPERHGQHRTAELIYRDSVHETYLHCRNNQLREVWAYLWTNWYTPTKWKLWARSAHPHAIPRKRTTMVVEAMWRNLKRLVLRHYNRPRVDFATYTLVTQALPAYRNKLVRIFNDPRKGWAAALHGEQIPIKKAWLVLRDKPVKGTYDTNIRQWTCSCGEQKYHSYLLCKHLVRAVRRPPAEWWATVVRHHTPPFYDIRQLLSPDDRLDAPEPEQLGNRTWLTRMDMPIGANPPTVSPLLVCTVYIW